MKRVLIIGCGDVALRTIPLLAGRYRLLALVRDRAMFPPLRALGVTPLWGDLDNRESLVRLAGIAEAVLHFAPPPGAGTHDARTRNLLGALAHGTLPKRMVYISTSGVYGDCAGARVDETRRLDATSPRAKRRVDAELQIRGWAGRNRVQASILRVPGIYAADRLPLERIVQGTPCIIDDEDGYTNHIHADDLARIGVAALQRGKNCRVYHASDDSRLKMGAYLDLVADACGLSRVPRISRDEARRVLPETLLSFINESRRLDNGRMKRELGVRLRYPTVAATLQAMNGSDESASRAQAVQASASA
ncbi:MAG TPA: SDR family oxidoreductase [Gallionella sp.]